jgi:hypothetical protein
MRKILPRKLEKKNLLLEVIVNFPNADPGGGFPSFKLYNDLQSFYSLDLRGGSTY